MKRIQGVAVLVGVLMTLCAAGAYGTDDPFPPKEIPGIAYDRDLCMWRINKSFDGNAEKTFWRDYDCRTGSTGLYRTEIALRVLSNDGDGEGSCDQEIPGLPKTMYMEAWGMTIYRKDGLAHFTGGVKLKDGAAGPVLFEGTIELMARIGTHQALGESCDEKGHMEGWIVARGVEAFSNLTLRAMVAGEASLPGGLLPTPPLNRITGVIIESR
jgi:hypothetical protein